MNHFTGPAFIEQLVSRHVPLLTYMTVGGLLLYAWLCVLTLPGHIIFVNYGIVLLLVLLNSLFRHKGYLRGVFIYLALFTAFHYWHWRFTQTISCTGIADLTASLMLVAAELYSAVLFVFSLFLSVSPIKRELTSPPDLEALPSVDVFIPTFTEPVDIVKITAVAALNMTYPEGRFKVHLLDDGSTLQRRNSKDPETRKEAQKRYETLKAFCREAGIIYHARAKNIKAKAGNLNHGFKKSSGDIIAVLDCDHVPTKDFLLKTTHHFNRDPKLFLVQTPHFFINPDPVDRNLRVFYSAPSENEMFYRGILPAMDFWNSAYFCGSAALLRRRHLEKIQGFSGETVTEDAETSIDLHAMGLNSIYIGKPLVCGLTPDIFADFISQKIRWAQGMIQILLLKKMIFKKGLRWYQKLSYFNCMFYWFFCYARLIFIIAPLFFLFFGMNVYNASMHQIFMFTVPYLMTLFITHSYLHGHVRWPLFSEIYEILESIYILPAITDVIINPRKPAFKVTAKGETLSADRLSALAYPFHILFWLLCLSMGLCIYKFFHEPFYRDTLFLTGAWIMFNATILFFALGVVYERKQVRKFHRAKAWKPVRLKTETAEFKGRLTDLSWNGVGMTFIVEGREVPDLSGKTTILYRENEDVELEIPVIIKHIKHVTSKAPSRWFLNLKKIRPERDTDGEIHEKETSRRDKYFTKINIGAEIALGESLEDLKKRALFVYGDSERWLHFWRDKNKRQNILYVLYYLFRNASSWSILGGLEFFRYNISIAKRFFARTPAPACKEQIPGARVRNSSY